MNIEKNMAINGSSNIFNCSTSESFSANPIEIIIMLNDETSYGKLVKLSWQNYNTDKGKVEKDFNVYLEY